MTLRQSAATHPVPRAAESLGISRRRPTASPARAIFPPSALAGAYVVSAKLREIIETEGEAA